MSDGVFGRSRQPSRNKFFDPSISSMRKVGDGGKTEKKGENRKRMVFIVATNIVASWRPERRLTGIETTRANSIIIGTKGAEQ